MALRALKTDEEIAGIPTDQSILIELPGAVIEDEGDNGIVSDKPVKTVEPVDGAKVLQEQLEAAQRAQAASDARAAKAEREAAEARALVAQAEKRTTALEGDVITGGLSAAQSERDSAKLAYANAFDAGDGKAMADANDRIARAAARILNFEAGAAEIAERPKVEARQEQTLQQPRDFTDQVRGNPNLLRSEQDWMIKNKDSFGDPDFNKKLDFAYAGAMQQRGLVRGSQAYFDYIERATGLVADNHDDNNGSRDVQAPPSRGERDASGKTITNRITLSPEEREIAKSMGVSDIEYARSKQNFEVARKADPEKYR